MTVTLIALLFWTHFFLTLIFALQELFLHSEILTLLSHFPLTSNKLKTDALFHCVAWLLLCWLGCFCDHLRDYGRISLNSVLLLLLVNFVSGFRLRLMYILLIVSTKSNLIHLHGFQQLVLLPYFIEITSFVCNNRINLLNLK